MPLDTERLEKFRSVVAKMAGPVSILIAQVDPDALGAAFGLISILKVLRPKNGLDIRVFYGGTISHPQNIAVVNRLDLAKRLKPVNHWRPAEPETVVLIDSSSLSDARLFVPLTDKLRPAVVIDHHRGGDARETEDSFVWVEDVGAASTMLVELWQALSLPLGDSTEQAALLLAIGIHTDTWGLTDCGSRDRAAFNTVADIVGNQELNQLFRYPLPPSHFKNIVRALQSQVVRDGKLVASIGTVDAKEGDDLSIIADSLIRMSSVTLVIVWAIFEKEHLVRLSARCSDITTVLDAFLRDRFGASSGAKLSSDGRGIGGATMNIDLGVWMIPETSSEVEALISKWVQTRTFQK